MERDLSYRNAADVDVGGGSHCIPRSHLDQRAGTENLGVDSCMVRCEKFLVAKLGDLVAMWIVHKPPHLGIRCIAAQVEDRTPQGILQRSPESPRPITAFAFNIEELLAIIRCYRGVLKVAVVTPYPEHTLLLGDIAFGKTDR